MKSDSLDKIYREYQMDVYRYLLGLCKDHFTAEDLMQETFCRAFIHLDQTQNEKVKPWLIRVAYHAFIDKTRKDSRMKTYDSDYFRSLPDLDTPEAQLMQSENKEQLYARLGRLSEQQQEAIHLYDIQGYSYREASEMMGMKLSRYKIVLYRARQRLKQDCMNGGQSFLEVI
ncbi:RNA polymerase subunit sigma-24 [Paenibacillus yonginensis]|uniref:RNA polymerase subunit sigma-24 n=1 Tax=Paenibacillus yonginensis TaxID=1462996 RepID=A0A1B1MY81_9BACL|nr:sigma-70 family RNA polymerase sigma factor [Paenibacillus yonginensis]ANS74131.1 RNA polymerase subunit sigma-24 [Paenibacillus yonginensis]